MIGFNSSLVISGIVLPNAIDVGATTRNVAATAKQISFLFVVFIIILLVVLG
jgi:hypothetical protein